MMAEIAKAYVQLIPAWDAAATERENRKQEKQNQKSHEQQSQSWGASIRTHVGGALGFIGKTGLAAVATIGAGVAGIAMKGGLDRALALNSARSKMKGLGLDTNQVNQIMGNVQKAVKGTAFSMGDAASVASSFATSGIKGGQEMERALQAVANVATVSGRSMQEIGVIFGQVKAKGRLMGDDIMQLNNSGVPALALVAKHLGITQEKAQEMATKGQISFDIFSEAMRVGLGDSATAASKTAQGAWANLKTALAKITEGFWTPLIENAAPVMIALQGVVEQFTAKLKPLTDGMSKNIEGMAKRLAGAIEGLKTKFTGFKMPDVSTIKSFFAGLLPAVGGLAGAFSGVAGQLPIIGRLFAGLTGPAGAIVGLLVSMWTSSETFRNGVKNLAKVLFDIAQQAMPVLSAAFKVGGDAIKIFADIIGGILDFISGFPSLIASIAGAIGGYIAAVKIVTGLIKAWNTVTKIAAGVQAALNFVMSANPIALIILAVIGLVAGFIYLWKNCEGFRNFFYALWDGIKAAAQAVADWFMNSFVPFLQSCWEAIKNGVQAVADFFSWAWNGLVETVSAIWNWIVNVITTAASAIWDGIKWYLDTVFQNWAIVWETIKTVAQTVWDWIVSIITGAINTVWSIIQTVMGVISGIWSAVWGAISGVASAIWGAITGLITGAINTVKSIITSVLNGIKSVWTSIWNAASSIVSSVWGRIKSVVSNAINGVMSVVGSIGGRVRSALSGAGSWLLNAGKQIIQGLINGIKSMFGKVKSALTGLTSKLKEWKGPPKKDKVLLTDAGHMVIEGFMRGLQERFARVRETLRNFTKSLQVQQPDLSGIRESMNGMVANLRVGLPDVNEIKEQVQRQVSAIRASVPDISASFKAIDRVRPIEVHQHIAVAEVPKTSALASSAATQARLLGKVF